MIGITPALFTRSGMNVLPPEYIRVPRTRFAYCTGTRRWPSWMKMIAAMTRTRDRDREQREGVRLHLTSAAIVAASADDAGEDDEADAVADAALADQLAEPHQDQRARRQRREDRERQAEVVGEGGSRPTLHEHRDADALQDRERHGQDARVLVDLVAPVLALFGEPLERGDRLVEERHDDRGVDVGVHPERDDRELREAATREQVEQVQELARVDDLCSCSWSTPGSGTCARNRNTTSIPSVKRILFAGLGCGTPRASAANMPMGQACDDHDRAAGGLDLLRAVADTACAWTSSARRSSPSARTLTRAWVAMRPFAASVSGVTLPSTA